MYVCNLHSGGGGGNKGAEPALGGGGGASPLFLCFFFLFPSADVRALPQKRRTPNRRLKATYLSN